MIVHSLAAPQLKEHGPAVGLDDDMFFQSFTRTRPFSTAMSASDMVYAMTGLLQRAPTLGPQGKQGECLTCTTCLDLSAHQPVTSVAADAAGDGSEEATAFDYRAHWKSLFFPALDSFSEYVVH